MKKNLVALVSVVLLAACQTAQPAVEVRTVEVPVIRVQRCIDPATIPNRPAKLQSPRPPDARRALDLAVAKVMQWERYGGEAHVLMNGCAVIPSDTAGQSSPPTP